MFGFGTRNQSLNLRRKAGCIRDRMTHKMYSYSNSAHNISSEMLQAKSTPRNTIPQQRGGGLNIARWWVAQAQFSFLSRGVSSD